MIIGLYSPVPRSGKTEVANYLTNWRNYEPVPFAATLKEMAIPLLVAFGYSVDEVLELQNGDKKAEIRGLPGVTLRRLYQTLGTEWGRNVIDQDLWLKAWKAKVARLHGEFSVVADDVRFLNEAQLIQSMGGQVWKIVRPDAEVTEAAKHSSEQGLEGFLFDRVIVNNTSLVQLRHKAAAALVY